jgi:hypothetical protein
VPGKPPVATAPLSLLASRWSVETIFRDTKQYAGLGACQCWSDAAMVRHVALVLVSFVVLQQLRCTVPRASQLSRSAGS